MTRELFVPDLRGQAAARRAKPSYRARMRSSVEHLMGFPSRNLVQVVSLMA